MKRSNERSEIIAPGGNLGLLRRDDYYFPSALQAVTDQMGPAQKHATHPTKIEPFIKMISNAQALEKLFLGNYRFLN